METEKFRLGSKQIRKKTNVNIVFTCIVGNSLQCCSSNLNYYTPDNLSYSYNFFHSLAWQLIILIILINKKMIEIF
jgi:hypothetical protein